MANASPANAYLLEDDEDITAAILAADLVLKKCAAVEGLSRFLYESETGKNWFDLHDAGKELWRVEARKLSTWLLEGK